MTPSRNPRRRDRLQQYQLQLLERMAAAKVGVSVGGKLLGVLLGAERCLLELTQIGEIIPAAGLAISPVPLVHNWYLGLANVRGKLTGIIDLALYQGGPAPLPQAASHLVTFAPALGFNCALLVTQVLGLHDFSATAPEPQWRRIDLALLVREARFLQVERAAVSGA